MQLTPFFKELIDKKWSEFAQMEHDMEYTSNQAVVFAIIRACAKGKLPAIKESLNRIDGKLAAEIEVEYPKFYYQFPYAKSVALSSGKSGEKALGPVADAVPGLDEPLTNSLRDTLKRMSNEKRVLVMAVLEAAKNIDTAISYQGDLPEADPLVKSVICAGLLKMAHDGKLGAIFEVFDQIDGKLADKVKVLGEDVYITSYAEIAPAGAKKNADGVYELVADNTTNAWVASLGGSDDRRFER